MNRKLLTRAFNSCALLYGVIDSQNIYKFLTENYKLKLDREDYINDLISRNLKPGKTMQFYVFDTDIPGQFYIVNRIYKSKKDIYELASSQVKKPFYVPNTLKAFLDFEDPLFLNKEFKEKYKLVKNFIYKYDDSKKTKEIVDDVIPYIIKKEYSDLDKCINRILNVLNRKRIYIKNINDADKLIRLVKDCILNLRLPINRGYTNFELNKLHLVDIKKMSLKITPTMKNDFIKGKLNIDEYIKKIKNSNLDKKEKDKILKDYLKIKKEIKK